MGSPMPTSLRPPIITQHETRTRLRRFLISSESSNSNNNLPHNATSPHRLPFLHNPHSHIFHFPLSLCSSVNISCPPLCSLLRSRSPHFRSLSSMTTPPQAVQDPQPSQSESLSIKTVRVAITGRVQGVFYRNWTIENAKQLGLKGWVRNRRDGSVEALFSGNPDSVEEMQLRCRRGPPEAVVTGLQVFPCSDDPGTGFERKPTL